MEGLGLYTWVDGRNYFGEYKGDKKNGYGIHKWSNGVIFSGNWRNGHQHGLGIYKAADGTIKYGLWEDGKHNKWYENDVINDINSQEHIWKQDFKNTKNRWDTKTKATALFEPSNTFKE